MFYIDPYPQARSVFTMARIGFTAMTLFSTLALTMSDPCLSYEPGTNHCNNCEAGYQFALINSTTTLCGYIYNESQNCVLNSSYYLQDPAFNSTYEMVQGYSIDNSYCFNCTTYFMLPSGENLCYSGCPQYESYLYQYKETDSLAIGCQVCALQDYQMKTIQSYSFIGLYVKTCTANIEDVACDFTEFYDPDLNRCVACSDRYPLCESCSDTECYYNLYIYFYGVDMYDYTTDTFSINKFILWLCSLWYGSNPYNQYCVPVTLPNCIDSYFLFDNSQYCYICSPGYQLSSDFTSCIFKGTNLSVNFFVASGAQYNTTDDISYYFTNSGLSPSQPYYFIASAIQNVFTQAVELDVMNATIYLGNGDHFFFYCNELSGSFFNAEGIIQYCVDYYEELHQFPVVTDNVYLYFKPLYCSLASELGYSNDSNFLSMCINSTSKATVYVNQAYSYFQIYGFAQFENIHFSGMNQLVKPVIVSNDMSTLPILFCNLVNEPAVGDQSLNMVKNDNANFEIRYKCINSNYTGSTIPNTTNSDFTCNRNQNSFYYTQEESSYTCSGEPTYYYYFYNPEYFTEIPVVPRRRNTLFNLYAFPEYMSTFNKPPQLNIYNCTFEYFLQNYESLINVETNDFQYVTLGFENPIIADDIDNYNIVSYNGGERGAKIKIQDSSFKHSSFCKGLIVYRKQPYIAQESDTYGNFTYYLMSTPYVQDNGSYIILKNSSFINLNSGFQNISALAIYEGKEVMRKLFFNNSQMVYYQGFLHRGIVLNVEDFGGYIEIVNCTFKQNMHFIPQIYNSEASSTKSRSVSSFMDNSQTNEYKMSVCSQDTKTDLYFFSDGVNQQDDLDTYYDLFERLSTIYISRNRDKVIIKDNIFQENIGTFGGAISINSQNWNAGKQPYILIYNNVFTKNMAYFSGNVIYIRNTLKDEGVGQICGGAEIKNNTFINNIGMKFHNGGAVSASCSYVTSHLYQDYVAASGYNISGPTTHANQFNQTVQITDPVDHQVYSILQYVFNVENNTFQENYAGGKGSALYIRMISNIRINNCSFTSNGPVLSHFETLYSPYYTYFSNRTMTYYDDTHTCLNEFEYLANCQTSGNQIDWSHVQGALYIEHCQTESCIVNQATMNLLLQNSVFSNNQVGSILDDDFPQNLSSQVFIQGGTNNTITNCSFNNQYGIYSNLIKNSSLQLYNYFPADYFSSQQASLIYIGMSPEVDYNTSFMTVIKNCTFMNNSHVQTLGLSESQYFYGSLIQYFTQSPSITSLFKPILQILGSQFIDNRFIGLQTQLIYLQNVLLTVTYCQFSNNGFLSESSEQYFDASKVYSKSGYFSFKSYQYQDIQEYGIFYMEGTQQFQSAYYHSIMNNTFKYTFSDQATIMFLNIGNQFLLLNWNVYTYNIASEGAIFSSNGLIYTNLRESNGGITTSTMVNTTFLVTNEVYTDQISSGGVFQLLLDNTQLTLNLFIQNSSFADTFSDSGIMSLSSLGKVQITNCSFKIASSKESIQINLENQFIQYSRPLSYFLDQTLILTGTADSYFSSSQVFYVSGIQNFNSKIYFANSLLAINSYYSQYMEIINCQFKNFFSTSRGVIISSESSYIYIQNDILTNRKMNNNSVSNQGIIYLYNSTLIGNNLQIQNSNSLSSASVFYLTDYSTLEIQNSQFINNTAYTQGLAYITGSSNFLCNNCTFSQNSVTQDSSIIYADNNPEGYIVINNSLIIDSTSKSNLMNLITSPTLIQSTYFIDNISQLVNHGITATNSEIQFINVNVNYTREDFVNGNDYSVDIGFFNLNFQSVLYLNETVIMNCRGGTAGVLYATGYSSVYVDQNSIFKDNLSSEDGNGGVFNFLTTQTVQIQNSQFINNGIVDINLQRANATIINTTFIQGQHQFIMAQTSSLTIANSSFLNGIDSSILGKALYCYCIDLSIINSTFQNLSALKGGAIYLTSQSSQSSFSINKSRFIQNSAQFGGSLYISDAASLQISNNTFLDNSASVISPPNEESSQLVSKGLGGAIYYACTNQAVYLQSNCSVKVTNQNVFKGNQAQNDGGAIIWVSNSYLDDSSNIFSSNQAVYGNNIASYPSYLKTIFVSNNDYYSPVNSSINNTFNSLVSGTPFSFIIQIFDQQNNIYSTDDESIATLKSQNSSLDLLLNGNEVKASKGVYNFSAVTAITPPGTSLNLTLSISGMTDYGNSLGFIGNPLTYFLEFRNCVEGEEMLNNACIPCLTGYYLYEAPTKETSCKVCNGDSICEGKNIVYPKATYWRANDATDDWILCPRPGSCLQGNVGNQTGLCDEGYTGIACADCLDNYSRNSDFSCTVCPNETKNIIKIAFISLIVILIVVFLVASTFSTTGKSKSYYSVYMKLMTNHLQIINAMSNINFQWPTYILSVYSSIVSISSFSTQMFSFDCFLMQQPASMTNIIGIYFQKLMVYAFLPFILAFFDIIFWLVYCSFKRDFKNIGSSFISTLVIILFLIHPTITQQMFMTFNCVDIDGKYYLRDDINYECYKGSHLKFLVIIVIPSIIIWSFGIPLFALILLLKNKKIILKEDSGIDLNPSQQKDLANVRRKYGFIFNGYKTKQFYYEIIILYRKVLLIMTTVILSVVSPEMQALLSILIIALSMVYQNERKPFQTTVLNRMETLSLIIATTTMYSGMYYITSEHYQYSDNQSMQWILFLTLAIPNLLFFGYWTYHMGLELVKMAHKRGKLTFRFATLCFGNYEEFGKKHMQLNGNLATKSDYNEESGITQAKLKLPISILGKSTRALLAGNVSEKKTDKTVLFDDDITYEQNDRSTPKKKERSQRRRSMRTSTSEKKRAEKALENEEPQTPNDFERFGEENKALEQTNNGMSTMNIVKRQKKRSRKVSINSKNTNNSPQKEGPSFLF